MKQKKRCEKCEKNQGNEYERIAACKLLTLEEKENIIRFRRIREQSADFMRKYGREG